MPYVPSEKTDGKSQDRVLIDAEVEKAATRVARRVINLSNSVIYSEYLSLFRTLGEDLSWLAWNDEASLDLMGLTNPLAIVIWKLGKKYGYFGAFLGELNYAVTRFIQRVPQLLVESGKWAEKDELRYWYYAITVSALTAAVSTFATDPSGVAGVFEDVKDEYKRRVNIGYEAAQILRSGDCFDTPWYTRLIEVVDQTGQVIGHQEVMLKRSPETVGIDLLPFQIVVRSKSPFILKMPKITRDDKNRI